MSRNVMHVKHPQAQPGRGMFTIISAQHLPSSYSIALVHLYGFLQFYMLYNICNMLFLSYVLDLPLFFLIVIPL